MQHIPKEANMDNYNKPVRDNHPPDISRKHIIDNLRRHDVSVVKDENGYYTLRKANVLERVRLPNRVRRHLIGRLSVKFNIGMGSFFSRSAVPAF